MNNEIEIIKAIKALSIAQISKAQSGHPGICLGAAPILYTLYNNHMRIDVKDDKWINRDRFVMSAGHGSALLYSTLYMSGFDLNINDLKNYRQILSKTPGHPEFNTTSGVDVTTGALGQGLSTGVGIAAASKYLSELSNGLIDFKTYVLCSEGDLMEGVSYEACSLAGNLKLNNLIVLCDCNNITVDGALNKTFDEDILKRFDAMGWNTQFVPNGDNYLLLDMAISKAKKSNDKPSFIQIKTTIGKDSMLEGTNKVHSGTLTKEDIRQLKDKLGLDNNLFNNIGNLRKQMVNFIRSRVTHEKRVWERKYEEYINSCSLDTKKFIESLKEPRKYDITKLFNELEFNSDELRSINGKVVNEIANNYPEFVGGSADVSTSTRTHLEKFEDFSSVNYAGKNFCFGVREHAMASFINGLSLCGLRPFSACFLSFSDYMKPSIRMASLMNIPSTFIFTHDSVMIGQDGPTHQPVEQLSSLRSIPNHYVYRPCDANEIIGTWQCILNSAKPSSVIISKEKCENLMNTDPLNVKKGAYIIRKETKKLFAIIIATGSEVKLAIDIAEKLSQKGMGIRVVSMPCMELFEEQSEGYKNQILPLGYKTFVIERASKFGWHRYVYNDDYIMGIDSFGLSGKKDDVLSELKLDDESIYKKIEKLLK